MLTGLLDACIVPMAVGGATSTDAVERISAHPDLCKGIAIISMGRCNRGDRETIIRDWKRAIKLLGHDRWFTVPLPKTSPRGTEKYAAYEAIDLRVKELAGDRFLDTHAPLAGPDGMIPRRFMHDPVHFNRAGNMRVAEFLAAELIARNLVPAKAALAA
jgi:hypothetical protein